MLTYAETRSNGNGSGSESSSGGEQGGAGDETMTEEYLCKWRNLQYAESTWETAEVLTCADVC